MKVYSISKWAFRGICLLILLLPVSRHWHLLSTGKRASGTVIQYGIRMETDIMGEQDLVEASEIHFEAGGQSYKTYGPDNFEYETGRTLTIFYRKSDPNDNCVATFTGFYLNNYVILSIILLTVWYAFYLSYNNYRRRMKQQKKKPKSASLISTLYKKNRRGARDLRTKGEDVATQ